MNIPISISAADAVIIVGVIQGAIGLFAPERVIAWQSFHVGTLVTTGVIVALVGFSLKVVFG